MEKWPLGVFASIDHGFGVQLDVARELGVPTLQLHAPQPETRDAKTATEFLAKVSKLGMTITAVFGGFAGESYADIPTVVRCVGLAPTTTRAARLAEMLEIADFAKLLEVSVVALHLGFVPHDAADPQYAQIVTATQTLCDHCHKNGQALHLETGQEPADVLLKFITAVDRPNLFINFDPANMILYGAGEPIEALKLLGRFVRSVHCKDATWAENPGQEWGREVALGQGAVNMELYLRTLDEVGYRGPLTIEREISQEPQRQKAEIGAAIRLLNQLKAKLA